MGPVTVKRSHVFCDVNPKERDWESTCSETVTWYWGCFCLRPRFLLQSTAISITPSLCLKMLFLRLMHPRPCLQPLRGNPGYYLKKVYDVKASISQWHLKFARWGIFWFVWAGSLAPMTSATKPQFFRVALCILLSSGISYRNWILTITPPQQGFATRASNLNCFTNKLWSSFVLVGRVYEMRGPPSPALQKKDADDDSNGVSHSPISMESCHDFYLDFVREEY